MTKDFLEKYQYIELDHGLNIYNNNANILLAFLSLYNLSSPVLYPY